MYVLWHSSEGKLELRGPNLIEHDCAGTPAKTGVEELEWPTVSTFPPELELDLETGLHFSTHKKMPGRRRLPGAEPAVKPCRSQTKGSVTLVGGAFTTDRSLTGAIFKKHFFSVAVNKRLNTPVHERVGRRDQRCPCHLGNARNSRQVGK